MHAKPKRNDRESLPRPIRSRAHQEMHTKSRGKATSKTVLVHHCHPSATKRQRDTHRDNMGNRRVEWSIHKEMDRWATIPTTPTHLTRSKARSTSNVSTRPCQPLGGNSSCICRCLDDFRALVRCHIFARYPRWEWRR